MSVKERWVIRLLLVVDFQNRLAFGCHYPKVFDFLNRLVLGCHYPKAFDFQNGLVFRLQNR